MFVQKMSTPDPGVDPVGLGVRVRHPLDVVHLDAVVEDADEAVTGGQGRPRVVVAPDSPVIKHQV